MLESGGGNRWQIPHGGLTFRRGSELTGGNKICQDEDRNGTSTTVSDSKRKFCKQNGLGMVRRHFHADSISGNTPIKSRGTESFQPLYGVTTPL